MELPPYHAPRLRHFLIHTWIRLKVFLFRAGKVIIGMVLVLGLLNSIGIQEKKVGFGYEGTELSLLARIGKKITPVFVPMGVAEENWPATVGIFTGVLAKESVVGTLNSLYGQSQALEEEEPFDLISGIREAFATIPRNLLALGSAILDPLGFGTVKTEEKQAAEELGTGAEVFNRLQSSFTPHGAYAYLLFILLYFPCIAAQGAAIRELGRRAGAVLGVYMTLLAWATAVLYFQILEMGSFLWISIGIVIPILLVVGFRLFGRKLLSLEPEV
jgi:ferrous iron transport protein B